MDTKRAETEKQKRRSELFHFELETVKGINRDTMGGEISCQQGHREKLKPYLKETTEG